MLTRRLERIKAAFESPLHDQRTAAGLTGAQFGFEASSFFDAEGPPPRTGQFFLAIDPAAFAGPSFGDRIETLCAAMLEDPAVRLPGERRLAARARFAHEGIPVAAKLLLCGNATPR